MDYIEKYLKCQLSNNDIRVSSFVVYMNKLKIDYFIHNEPRFEIVHRFFEATYSHYIDWKKNYLRKNKLNKIKNRIK